MQPGSCQQNSQPGSSRQNSDMGLFFNVTSQSNKVSIFWVCYEVSIDSTHSNFIKIHFQSSMKIYPLSLL